MWLNIEVAKKECQRLWVDAWLRNLAHPFTIIFAKSCISISFHNNSFPSEPTPLSPTHSFFTIQKKKHLRGRHSFYVIANCRRSGTDRFGPHFNQPRQRFSNAVTTFPCRWHYTQRGFALLSIFTSSAFDILYGETLSLSPPRMKNMTPSSPAITDSHIPYPLSIKAKSSSLRRRRVLLHKHGALPLPLAISHIACTGFHQIGRWVIIFHFSYLPSCLREGWGVSQQALSPKVGRWGC